MKNINLAIEISFSLFLVIAYLVFSHLFSGSVLPSEPENNALNLLQHYIQINTAQPDPDYETAISFLKKHAKHDALDTQEIILPSGRKSLIISLKGTNNTLPALALNHHMDVVAANPQQWKRDPFSGTIYNDTIYGRGTQDMKGVGMCHYCALKELKESGAKLKRTVYLIIVPEEEIGGFKGAGQLVRTQQYKDLNIGYMIDESIPSANDNMLYIKTSERRPLQIRFNVEGKTAHGSQLNCTNVLHTMIDFLQQMTRLQKEQQRKTLSQDPGLLLSMNITSLHAGIQPNALNPAAGINVVPCQATATVDIRIPAAMKQAEAKTLLKKLMTNYPEITYEIVAEVGEYDTPNVKNSDLYKCIEKAIAHEGLDAKELHMQATTDLRHYIPYIKAGCGLTPFTTKDNLHGIDESIPVHDFMRGIHIFKEIILRFCS